jgi:tetratricopeptide (TPR) repeat protein
MHIKQLFCTLLFVASATHPSPETDLFIKPGISAETTFLSGGAGIAAAAAATFGLGWLCNYLDITEIPLFFGIGSSAHLGPIRLDAAAGAAISATPKYIIGACGATLGCLAAWLTYRYQPEGKFSRAHSTLKEALLDEVLNELIAHEETLLNALDNTYIQSAYPRVEAYNNFIAYLKNLEHAVKLFKEVLHDTSDDEYITRTHSCLRAVETYIEHIKYCIRIIRTAPNWQEELNGYNIMLSRLAQQQTAIATQNLALNTAFHCH